MRAVMRGLWLACRHGGARLLPGPAPCRAGREAMRLAGSQAALRSSAAAFSKCPTYPRNVWLHCSRTRQQRARFVTTAVRSKDIQADVGLLVEGEPRLSDEELDELSEGLYKDARRVVQEVALYLLRSQGEAGRTEPPGPMELSVVLCDDAYIRGLNAEWRGKDAPTDVLSFEMPEDEGEDGLPAGLELPVAVLGDVVVSLDTAARQAAERGYGLRDECRVLLVHGVLHLFGFDHELGEAEAEEMAAAEAHVLSTLDWVGQGLISAANDSGRDDPHDQEDGDSSGSGGGMDQQGRGSTGAEGRGGRAHAPPGGPSTSTSAPTGLAQQAQQQRGQQRWRTRPEVQLLCLDMDGTLLDSSSKVLPSSVPAIRAAIARGVTVCLATGKARPAAIRALEAVGLAGEGLVVSRSGPGVFLQGLAAYGRGGELIAAGELPGDVVRDAFLFSEQHGIPCCGFLGEECITLELHPELEELHHRYYEPLAQVAVSVEQVLSGPPLRKLLFMTQPHVVEGHLKPHWEAALEGTDAQTMQAVPDMLEVVPVGWNKWRALERLLDHMEMAREAFMAIGDGSNDLDMVANAGVGVAMGNAVRSVKEAASLVVASNDEDGIAEAIELLIL